MHDGVIARFGHESWRVWISWTRRRLWAPLAWSLASALVPIIGGEVASEVVHDSTVSTMRRRKKARLSPVNRFGGSVLGCGLAVLLGFYWAAAAGIDESITRQLLLPLLSLALTLTFLHRPTPALCIADHPDVGATQPQTFILVLKSPAEDGTSEDDHRWWLETFMPSPLAGSYEPQLLHTYTEVFTGLATRLTDVELDMVSKNPRFLRAFPDQI
ncbi:hypothetical protein QYE76_070357 [Lolium multiflorum]|uniref:Inhibitor I9 domain-containing protein n=1 Tax=Lolium multiflorum TaxID=4521 RepID=A0AAD8SI18_LOLMU|nr:hypothetical protein QYE76_070357 [Lolium multiflorum]